MKNKLPLLLALLPGLLALSCQRKAEAPADARVVRCAIIGGMTMTGLWPEIAKKFEAATGYRAK
ncbi:MAG TPA: hypothetical protein VFC44_16940, partial [Candidatus Saccharimonadales bacterium]|nr:hypothetical protein [Candidatus Saccharimonadales bacterium]